MAGEADNIRTRATAHVAIRAVRELAFIHSYDDGKSI